MKFSNLILLYLFIVFMYSCNSGPDPVFPGKEWMTASPESQHVDQEKMKAALELLASYCGEDGLEEVFVVRNGYVIYAGDSVLTQHNIYSCSKSFTSTVLGLLIEDNKCRLDDFAFQYEPLLQDQYDKIQLKHFASMTSGYSAVGVSRWNEPSEDWSHEPYRPAEPLFAPGKAYAYWDEAMMMNGRVLTKIAGEDILGLIKTRITDHMDIGTWDWFYEGETEKGIIIRNGCTGIKMNATQLARIGLLFLNKGRWNGKQLISQSWVVQSTRNQVSTDIQVADTDRKSIDGVGRYGFNWWVRGNMGDMPDTPPETYYMSGFNNNMCFVIPEWDMVFVRMGMDGNPPEGKRVVYNEFFGKLNLAIKN